MELAIMGRMRHRLVDVIARAGLFDHRPPLRLSLPRPARWARVGALGAGCGVCLAGAAWASDNPLIGSDLITGLGSDEAHPFGDESLGRGSFSTVDLTAVFPEGLFYGGQRYHELYVSTPGLVSFDRPRGYVAEGLPRSPSRPLWAINESDVAGGPSTRGNVDHQVYVHQVPAAPGGTGELIVTWHEMGLWPGDFSVWNSFQMRLYAVDGEPQLELRYALCMWSDASVERPSRLGFDHGDDTGWQWSESDPDATYLLCSRTNAEARGVWRYRIVDGHVVGCGDGVVQPGEDCDDGNAGLGDGCTPNCRVEIDIDADGQYEAPVGLPFAVPEDTYDDCLPDWAVPEGEIGCDADPDQDGIRSDVDNCPGVWNVDQTDTDKPAVGIGDRAGDACDSDDDNDGLNDAVDNCPLVRNGPDDVGLVPQADLDGDGIGDVCDADADGDGIDEIHDNCPGWANPAQIDRDGDGRGQGCDLDGDDWPAPRLDARHRVLDAPLAIAACGGRPCAPAGVDDPGTPGGGTAPDQDQPPRLDDFVIAEPGPDSVLRNARCSARPGSDTTGGPLAVLGLLLLARVRRWRQR